MHFDNIRNFAKKQNANNVQRVGILADLSALFFTPCTYEELKVKYNELFMVFPLRS